MVSKSGQNCTFLLSLNLNHFHKTKMFLNSTMPPNKFLSSNSLSLMLALHRQRITVFSTFFKKVTATSYFYYRRPKLVAEPSVLSLRYVLELISTLLLSNKLFRNFLFNFLFQVSKIMQRRVCENGTLYYNA
jgi:hypothetical protein